MTAALAASRPAPGSRPGGPVWWARITRRSLPPVEHSLVAVGSDRFPAGTPVDLAALDARGRRPSGWLVDLRYRTADGAVVRIDVAEPLAGTVRPIWFTETHHGGAPIPTVSLAAHTGGDVPAGALVSPRERGTLLGTLRWQVRSGLVESLTMPPASRPGPVEGLLPVVADVLATLRGWPRPHGELPITAPAAPRGVERLVGDLPARLI